MYLRHTTRRKNGKAHRYWQLVRSVRVGRKVVQQTVAHLGELDVQGRARARALARAITGDREQSDLFIGEEADELRLRCVVRPDAAQAALLDRLGLDLPHRLRVPPPVTQIAEV